MTNTIHWGHNALEVELGIDEDNAVRLSLPGGEQAAAPLPLVEVTAAGHGRRWSSDRLVDTAIGARLRYRTHSAFRDGDWHVLTVDLHDPLTGLAAQVVFRSPDGIPVLRGEVVLRNEGESTL
ncbi:hypothetical protein, partial [Kutzneria sp. 744]|uniref:hypothetical protein n=1 Tax=Kutzneria sp. (strain 744) TaxID=345341 RepID=UPI0003EEC351